MFSSKIYPLPYTKNKSKEFYCCRYVVKLFLYISFFIFPLFNLSCILCYVNIFYKFLGGLHLFSDSFFIFKENTLTLEKSHYRQIQVLIMIFNKKALVNTSSTSNLKNPPWNLLSFVSRIVVNECLQNSVRNCFTFASISKQ